MTTNTASDLVADIRKRHVPNPAVETYSCRWCGEGYPCETVRAADEIERLRRALRNIESDAVYLMADADGAQLHVRAYAREVLNGDATP